ncbi:MAG: hypothetical protein C4B56_07255 [Candidatus Methanophagaceae archaeon]|nr:MAG: hypothetical protein C4B56_07255 [Methanophagales archaeon]
MDTTYRIRLIVAVAVASVALTIAVAGIASASPPVPAPNETSLIETSVDATVYSGSYYEEETFDWTYSTKELNDTLENDERVAQIRYDERTSATDGYFEIKKGFTADGQNTPNLKVDKKIGFIAGTAVTSSLDSTENTGMTIVSEGDTAGGTGVPALCPWAQGACIPPTNELVAAGSQLKDVTLVNSHTITTVQTTESPQLHHEITAGGPTVEGGNMTAGMGTVAAGMKVSTMEGLNCNSTHPLASRLTYSELSRATGMWDFYKSMTYTAQIPAINLPSQYPIFPWP